MGALTAGTRSQRAAPVPRPRLDPAMLTSITYIGSRECPCHDATPVIPWNHPAHTLPCWLVDLDAGADCEYAAAARPTRHETPLGSGHAHLHYLHWQQGMPLP